MLNNPKHGVTGPVSLKKSNDKEDELTKDICEYLKESNFYEDQEESINRERSLGKISSIFDEFVKKCAKKFDIAIENDKPLGIIYSFGSYRLGVHSRGADIDTLCIGPSYLERKDFFTDFYNMLKESDNITDVVSIESAHVPMIGIKISDISIDLVFAKLNIKYLPHNLDILDNKILKNLEEKCVISLNGSRVSSEILRLIPNTEVFHAALRCIKLWATKRYIYGNSYGYFGGVAFAITVARICQLYPNSSASLIIQKYFEVLSKWKWPNPIILKEIEDCHYNLKIWNPKLNPTDKYHKMPIITPAYPSMCATHNISQSTMQRILLELQRGALIMKRKDKDFKELFAPSNFFENYENFLLIFSVGKSKTNEFEENFSKFNGFVASRIRLLITRLEVIEEIDTCPPFPIALEIEKEIHEFLIKKFDFYELHNYDAIKLNILGVEYSQSLMLGAKEVNISRQVQEFNSLINDFSVYDDDEKLEIEGDDLKCLYKTLNKEMMIDFMIGYNKE